MKHRIRRVSQPSPPNQPKPRQPSPAPLSGKLVFGLVIVVGGLGAFVAWSNSNGLTSADAKGLLMLGLMAVIGGGHVCLSALGVQFFKGGRGDGGGDGGGFFSSDGDGDGGCD